MNAPTVRKLSERETSPTPLDDGENGLRNKRPRFVTDLSSPLCEVCQQLDLDAKFDRTHEAYRQVRAGVVSPPEDIYKASDGSWYYADAILAHRFNDSLSKPSDCPLCEFFRSLRVQPDSHKRHKLLAFRCSDSWLFRAGWLRERNPQKYEHNRDSVFMAVVPDLDTLPSCGYEANWLDHDVPATGAIYRLRPMDDSQIAKEKQILLARELDEGPNLGGARQWLGMCQKDHGSCCKRRTSHEPILSGFRLVDCTKEPPVVEEKPWGTTYLALSYVWGTTPKDLAHWPETVLDAVEVTKKLGFDYLWVDRLCINQADADEMAHLISRMTTIYEAAELTIVAAAGSGASRGLPGVRSRPRRPQPKYYLDSGSVLLSMLRDPRRDILESTYWTRGWTYQEGVLSNRRLVFTDEQMYWECRNMAAQESIDVVVFHVPVTKAEDDSEFVMADFMLSGIFKGDAYSGSRGDAQDSLVTQDEGHRLAYGFPTQEEVTVRAQLRGLNEHTREYSKRQLTRDEDTLSALQGIFGLYAQTRQLYLLHGLPVWTDDIVQGRSGAQITFALSVSSWYHRTSSDLLMYVSEACRRKSNLPSWTWAGWVGTVSWRALPNLEHCAYMSDLINAESLKLLWAADISLYGADYARPIRLQETHSAALLVSGAPRTLLEIENPFLLNKFQRVEQVKKEWYWAKAIGRPGRQKAKAQELSWDAKWYRIGGRLSCVGTSVAMTEREWTAKHVSGELVSVLMFAGQYLVNEHGTARFLTLRRVPLSMPERWERVGTLYLVIPFNQDCRDVQEFLGKIPARRQHRSFVIQ
ncbi:hypothetical protein CLCR_00161 [Cladophialophora carrionii]|uniref:Heterokaryon incompatibility domain-containing protein n=1 Tax=Cladophialophora carrionii TaxID=86049 RepID=A0A1C1D0H6_9EURO|nr:hypothetical protein CLCR_00161 [Cladophialophora carrionii]